MLSEHPTHLLVGSFKQEPRIDRPYFVLRLLHSSTEMFMETREMAHPKHEVSVVSTQQCHPLEHVARGEGT